MEPELTIFKNNYVQDRRDLESTDPDAFACITVDGYAAEGDDCGRTVCKVWLTMDKDLIVCWNENKYQRNKTALELVDDAKTRLYDMWNEAYAGRNATCTVTVYVYVEFDNGTATICRYAGEHDGGLSDRLPADVCGVTVSYYHKMGLNPVKAYPVTQAAYDAYIKAHPDHETHTVTWDSNNQEDGSTPSVPVSVQGNRVAVIRSSAVRDVQYAAVPDAPLEDDSAWLDMDEAEIFLGIFPGSADEAKAAAADYACTDPANIRLIDIPQDNTTGPDPAGL